MAFAPEPYAKCVHRATEVIEVFSFKSPFSLSGEVARFDALWFAAKSVTYSQTGIHLKATVTMSAGSEFGVF
ncbi:hypothetical protein CMV30_15055 [Nibricoccus aquaticus]|uniref:Uncharacterized protein n=1 Tax=Nibricoccus aquaticus TaxID=2576891 RepID=A0A290Q8X9_9BACT|nr:hypothetical protein CMV30_15055 [Nibricoccus aquaticus]